jgi:hypothetical protein
VKNTTTISKNNLKRLKRVFVYTFSGFPPFGKLAPSPSGKILASPIIVTYLIVLSQPFPYKSSQENTSSHKCSRGLFTAETGLEMNWKSPVVFILSCNLSAKIEENYEEKVPEL